MYENQANQPGELRRVFDPEHFLGGATWLTKRMLTTWLFSDRTGRLHPYWPPAPGVRVSREHDFSTFANFELKLSATHGRRNRRATLQ